MRIGATRDRMLKKHYSVEIFKKLLRSYSTIKQQAQLDSQEKYAK